MFRVGQCAFGAGKDPHFVMAIPDRDLPRGQEVARAPMPDIASGQMISVVSLPLAEYLYLVACGATDHSDTEATEILNRQLGPGLREFFKTGVCPHCFDTRLG